MELNQNQALELAIEKLIESGASKENALPLARGIIDAENQGIKSDFYADQLFRGGAAYLVTEDFQIDAAVLLNVKDTPSRLYGRLGVSYRFDMHKNDEYIEDKGKSGREKKKKERTNTKKKKGKKSKEKDHLDIENDG